MNDVEYEVYSSNSHSLNFSYAESQIKVKQLNERSGCAVRTLKDGRIGFSYYQEDFNLESQTKNSKYFKNAFNNSLKLSANSPETEFEFAQKTSYRKVKTFNKKILEIKEMETKEFLEVIADSMKKADNKRIFFDSSYGEIKLENSNQLNGNYKYAILSIYAEANCGKGSGYSYYSGIDIPSDLNEIGEHAYDVAKQMNSAKKLQSGSYNIIFSPEVFHEMLNFLVQSFSGELKRKGATKIEKNKKMFSDMLTVYDDPFSNGSGARPFDDEGVSSRKICLVDNGVAKKFLYDRETAAIEKIKEDGSCTRAEYNSRPSIGRSNIVIKEGGCKNVLEETDSYIYLRSIHGMHTANPTSGDFGVEVNSANFKKGKVEKPVKGFMITGNIFEMFNNILEIGSKSNVNDDVISPDIVFEKISVVS